MVHSSQVKYLYIYFHKGENVAQKVYTGQCMHIPLTTKLEYAMKSLVAKEKIAWTLL